MKSIPVKENKLDVRKAYDAIAEILGDREGVKITVKSLEEVKEAKEETA